MCMNWEACQCMCPQYNYGLSTREYWMFIEDLAFLFSYNLAPPPPIRNMSIFLSLPVCHRSRGGGMSLIILQRESLVLYKSFNTLFATWRGLLISARNVQFCIYSDYIPSALPGPNFTRKRKRSIHFSYTTFSCTVGYIYFNSWRSLQVNAIEDRFELVFGSRSVKLAKHQYFLGY